ncbi:MAG: hypothetical protein AAGH92_12570 [Planctomycetota bacterium]
MTVAICIRCGTQKFGALIPCRDCGFTPESPEDQAKSLALSDHNLPLDQLNAISQRIRVGEPPTFDEASLQQLTNELSELPSMKPPIGCAIAVWVPFVVMLLLFGVLGWALFYVWSNQP